METIFPRWILVLYTYSGILPTERDGKGTYIFCYWPALRYAVLTIVAFPVWIRYFFTDEFLKSLMEQRILGLMTLAVSSSILICGSVVVSLITIVNTFNGRFDNLIREITTIKDLFTAKKIKWETKGKQSRTLSLIIASPLVIYFFLECVKVKQLRFDGFICLIVMNYLLIFYSLLVTMYLRIVGVIGELFQRLNNAVKYCSSGAVGSHRSTVSFSCGPSPGVNLYKSNIIYNSRYPIGHIADK